MAQTQAQPSTDSIPNEPQSKQTKSSYVELIRANDPSLLLL